MQFQLDFWQADKANNNNITYTRCYTRWLCHARSRTHAHTYPKPLTHSQSLTVELSVNEKRNRFAFLIWVKITHTQPVRYAGLCVCVRVCVLLYVCVLVCGTHVVVVVFFSCSLAVLVPVRWHCFLHKHLAALEGYKHTHIHACMCAAHTPTHTRSACVQCISCSIK